MLLNRGDALGLQQREVSDEKLLYNTDFESCLDSNGQPVPCGNEVPVAFPMAGDFDFMCFNNGNSLAPIIMPGDFIALKKLTSWKTYIPGDIICVVITNEYKMLRKVSVTQDDDESITFTHHRDLQGCRQLPPPVNRPGQTRHPPTQLTKSRIGGCPYIPPVPNGSPVEISTTPCTSPQESSFFLRPSFIHLQLFFTHTTEHTPPISQETSEPKVHEVSRNPRIV